MKAVVFDLWETLVDWPLDEGRELYRRLAARMGLSDEEFQRVWRETYDRRQVTPYREYFASIGVGEDAVAELVEMRTELTRRVLVPRPGAVETLRELRRRGLRLGLISACTDDVPAVWPETELAPLFDSTVFSCRAGVSKPDPRIYRLACDELGVEAGDCLFVGDGANNELAGAELAGMRAVLIHRADEEPVWPEVKTWAGLRITSIPEVLRLL